MELQDFFEGVVRTGVAAANSYLDAEIEYLNAKDAQTKAAAATKLAEERNRLVRQQQNFDNLMKVKEYQSRAATEQRIADREQQEQTDRENREKARKDNITRFGEASGKFAEAREKYRSDPSDENWSLVQGSANHLRDISGTMGDDVDVSSVDTIMGELTTERDNQLKAKEEQDRKDALARVNKKIQGYSNDRDNPAAQQAAKAAILEGLELDPDNPVYTRLSEQLFPDDDMSDVSQAREEEAQLEKNYEEARNAYRKAPPEEREALKGQYYDDLRAYIDNQDKLGKDISVLRAEATALGVSKMDDEDVDDDAVMSEEELDAFKADISGLVDSGLIRQDQADTLLAIADAGDTSASEITDMKNKMMLDDLRGDDEGDKETLDDLKRRYAERYPAGSPMSIVMQKLSTSASMGTAMVIDNLMTGKDDEGNDVVRSLPDLSESELDSLAESILSWHENVSSSKGEVLARVDSMPVRSLRALAGLFQTYKGVREQLSLITFSKEGLAKMIGQTAEDDVRMFLTQLDEYLDSDTRLRSGAQTAEAEIKRIKGFHPNIKNVAAANDAVFKALGKTFRNQITQGMSDTYGKELGLVLGDHAYDRIFEVAGEVDLKATNFEILPPDATPEELKATLDRDYADPETKPLVINYYKELVQEDLDKGMSLEESKAETRKNFEEKMLVTGDMLEELMTAIYEGFDDGEGEE